MTIKKSKIYLILVIIIFTIPSTIYLPIDNQIRFLEALPDMLGILLSGVLASLAIIFGMLSSKDLSKLKTDLRKRDEKKSAEKTKSNPNEKNKKDILDTYQAFVKETRQDTLIIFSSLIVSNIIYLYYDFKKFPSYLEIQERICFAINFILFFLSLYSTLDIINCLFDFNEIRYEISDTLLEPEKQEHERIREQKNL